MTTASQEWQEFAKTIGLPPEGTVQHQEMRRAFFAGQLSLFVFQVSELALQPDRIAEMAMEARHNEITEFFKNFSTRN